MRGASPRQDGPSGFRAGRPVFVSPRQDPLAAKTAPAGHGGKPVRDGALRAVPVLRSGALPYLDALRGKDLFADGTEPLEFLPGEGVHEQFAHGGHVYDNQPDNIARP